MERQAIILMACQFNIKYCKPIDVSSDDALSSLPIYFDEDFDNKEAVHNTMLDNLLFDSNVIRQRRFHLTYSSVFRRKSMA